MPIQTPLQVRFMSVFELTGNGKKLNVVQDSTSKLAQLLAILLFFHEEGIPREKLLAMLYQGEDADAANSLKALLFRLRKRLAACGLPDCAFVSVKDGVYRFSDVLEVETDVDRLNALLRQGDGEADPAQKAAYYLQALQAYRGEILPQLSQELWVIVENAALTEKIILAARFLCDYLTGKRDYERAYQISRRMSDFFPFDEEWHVGRMNSLIAQGKYQQAMDEYEAVTSMLFDEMGVYPSERIMDCARAISDKITFNLTAAADVDQSLREQESSGAYYCSYPSFVDSYHILRRIMSRDGIASCLLLCALVDEGKRPLEEKKVLIPAIQRLSLCLGRRLRKSDMYTRYSPSQMLVMLWGCEPENAEISIHRINQAFMEQDEGRNGVEISYTVLAGDEPPRPIVLAGIGTEKKKWKRMG